MSSRRISRLALALLLAGAATGARADFKQTYSDGLKAFENRDWRELARLMQKATDENPQEARAIRIYGMAFQPYVPYYYLGVARAEMGSCDAALAAWQRSEDQGVIQKLPEEYGELRSRRSLCLAPEVEKVEAAIRRARESARRLSDISEEPLLSEIWSREAFAGREREAVKRLDSADAALGSAKSGKGVDEIQKAGQLASSAQQDLDEIYRQAEERRGELARALETELRSRRQRIGALTPAARAVLDKAELPGVSSAVGRELAELLRALEAASTAGSVTSAAELDRLLVRLSDAKGALETALDDYGKGAPVRQEIEKLAADARDLLLRAGQLPRDAGVAKQSAALEQALEAASAAPSARSVTDLRGMSQRLRETTAALRGAVDQYRAGTPVRQQIEELTRQAAAALQRAGRLEGEPGVAARKSALERAVSEASNAGSVRSTDDLEKLRRGLSDAIAGLESAVAESQRAAEIRDRIPALSGKARSVLQRTEGLPPDAGVAREKSALERAMSEASKAASVRSADDLEKLSRGLSDSTTALERVLADYRRRLETEKSREGDEDALPDRLGPPQLLRDAVRAYLGGEFGLALEILKEASFDDGRATLQAHLFRAAARHALYRQGGGRDETLLEEAAADVRACRERDPDFEPDSEAFSPAFLDFYEKPGA